jgi:putative ABC transport system permease protein
MFFKRSVALRKGRVVIAVISVTLAVAVVTGMFGITAGIGKKLGSELRAYGANIIVTPRGESLLDNEITNRISRVSYVENITQQVFERVFINGKAIEVIGIDMAMLKTRGWKHYGRWPEDKGEIIAGINLKEALAISENQALTVESEGRERDFFVKGFVERGGAEDNALIMSIQDAWSISGSRGMVSALLIRGESGKLKDIVEGITTYAPEVKVRTILEVAVAEQSLLHKIQLLMALVTVVVLLASGISIASTMGANVLERREEIGLMKAIGATKKQIGLFYVAETVFIGTAGGIIGCVLGYCVAQIISKGAFESFISFAFYIPFFSLIFGVLLSFLAGYFPVQDAMKYNPAEVLRGE